MGMLRNAANRALAKLGYRKSYVPYERYFERALLDLDDRPLERPYEQHSWIYACIRSIATRVASVPFQIKQGEADNARMVEDGRLYNVFNRPNNRWSHFHLWEATTTHLMLEGNALWILDRVRDTAEPQEIWVFGKNRFEPVFEPNSSSIQYWKFRQKKGKILRLEPFQVLMFHLFSPYSEFWGQGPLAAARQSAEQDWLAQLLNRAFFENSADPGGIIKVTRQLDPEQRKQLREQWQSRHMGAQKAFKVGILEGDMEYQQLQLSHKDIAFIEQRKLSREEICGVFHVPPSELGLFDKVQKAVQKNVEKSYIEGTIQPITTLYEEVLRSQFFLPYDEERTWATFDYSGVDALQEEYDARAQRAKVFFDMGLPFNAINERFDLGFEPIEGGDVGYLPIGLRPTNEPWIAPTAPGGNTQKAIAPAEYKLIETVSETPCKGGLVPWSEEHLQYCGQWAKAMAKSERIFNGNLRSYLDSVKKYLGAQIALAEERYTAVKFFPETILDITKTHNVKLSSISRNFYDHLAVDVKHVIESSINGAGVPFVFEPNDTAVVEFLDRKTNQIVENLNVHGIRDRVRKEVQAAKRAGETVGELQERVFAAMKDSRTRSLTVARTESAQAANGMHYESMVHAGVKRHQWIAALDERARQSHVYNMQLGPWPIGKIYPNRCYYASSMSGPPGEVINCRCDMMAVD